MSYKAFDFSLPTRICFGVGESEKAAAFAAQLNPKKIMIMTYGDFRLPLLDKLLADLPDGAEIILARKVIIKFKKLT